VSFGRDGCHGFQVNLAVILGSAVDTWATVAVAIGTIGAVAYALFRDLVVTPRRRPKLELRFDRGGNDQVVVETEAGSEAAYARLRVANRGGRDTADDVVVMVTELRRLENSETRPIGLPLAWSGSRPPLTVASVHPGSERHVDLLHLSEAVPVQLDLTPQPTGGRGVLEAGAYEISVEVRARNADAICYAVPVSWDGKWSEKAAMWDHLLVDPPRKVR
jgi:hypothetical protein